MSTHSVPDTHPMHPPVFKARTRPGAGALVVLFGAAVLALACGGKKDPEPLPSQTSTQVTPQLEPPPPLPPPIRDVRPTRSTEVKVIDPGGDDGEPKTLLEASALARELKAQESRETIADINDDNLHEFAEGGEIILLEGEPAAPPATLREKETVAPGNEIRDEPYWRNGALELRMGWRRTVDRITDLELESAALRQEFYAEEDTYIRDSQIKPAWDRVLDQLEQLRDRSQRYEQELDTLVQEGQQAGVPQGWLTEGWELEPTVEERERVRRFGSHQAVEPQPVTHEVKDP